MVLGSAKRIFLIFPIGAISNFSKCSRVTKVHPADSENRPPGLHKTIKKKTYTDISRFNPMAPGLNDLVRPYSWIIDPQIVGQWVLHCWTGNYKLNIPRVHDSTRIPMYSGGRVEQLAAAGWWRLALNMTSSLFV